MDHLVKAERRFGWRLAFATAGAGAASAFLFVNERHILEWQIGAEQAAAAIVHQIFANHPGAGTFAPHRGHGHSRHLRNRLIETPAPDSGRDFGPAASQHGFNFQNGSTDGSHLPDPIAAGDAEPYFVSRDNGIATPGSRQVAFITNFHQDDPEKGWRYIGPRPSLGLAESFFVGPGNSSAVPEPTTWWTMIAGLFTIGGILRARPLSARRSNVRRKILADC